MTAEVPLAAHGVENMDEDIKDWSSYVKLPQEEQDPAQGSMEVDDHASGQGQDATMAGAPDQESMEITQEQAPRLSDLCTGQPADLPGSIEQ